MVKEKTTRGLKKRASDINCYGVDEGEWAKMVVMWFHLWHLSSSGINILVWFLVHLPHHHSCWVLPNDVW
jgi:hypothetical protein